MNLVEQSKPISDVDSQVARYLFENAGDHNKDCKQLTRREMANSLNIDGYTIHMSLKYLCNEGLIRIERGRIVLKKELVELVNN